MFLWTPAYGQSKAGRPARTFIQQLCDDTGCNPEDLPKAMNDRETWSGISVLAARHDDDDDIFTPCIRGFNSFSFFANNLISSMY